VGTTKKNLLFQSRNNKNQMCYSKVGTTKIKRVVPKWEQQKSIVLFQSRNNKNQMCCSEVGTTKIKRVVSK